VTDRSTFKINQISDLDDEWFEMDYQTIDLPRNWQHSEIGRLRYDFAAAGEW
jgi:hypothetical protein